MPLPPRPAGDLENAGNHIVPPSVSTPPDPLPPQNEAGEALAAKTVAKKLDDGEPMPVQEDKDGISYKDVFENLEVEEVEDAEDTAVSEVFMGELDSVRQEVQRLKGELQELHADMVTIHKFKEQAEAGLQVMRDLVGKLQEIGDERFSYVKDTNHGSYGCTPIRLLNQ